MRGSENVKLLAILEVLTAVLLKIPVFRHVTLLLDEQLPTFQTITVPSSSVSGSSRKQSTGY